MNLGNPIKEIDNVDVSDCASSFSQLKSDVSEANAGRTEDGVMHKLMLGTNTKCEIGFQNISSEKLHRILQLMKGEYHSISYIDMEDGSADSNVPYAVTKTFYVGDRQYNLYNAALDIWESLTFSVIQQDITNV